MISEWQGTISSWQGPVPGLPLATYTTADHIKTINRKYSCSSNTVVTNTNNKTFPLDNLQVIVYIFLELLIILEKIP